MVEVGDVAAEGDGPAIIAKNLGYSPIFGPKILHDVNLDLPRGSRCLLCGANGSGKSTLLGVLAGKFMVPQDSVLVLGRPAFHDLTLVSSGDVAYLGTQWRKEWSPWSGGGAQLVGDLTARTLLSNVPGADPVRRDALIDMLEIDLDWRMLSCSDGQRRRVQVAMGLLRPYRVLLLDEITVDMDVVGRLDLLEFLRHECEARGTTVVYATHIFDGLEGWPSHLVYMEAGTVVRHGPLHEFPDLCAGARLLKTVEAWLLHERQRRRAARKAPLAREEALGLLQASARLPSRQLAFYR